MDMMDTIRYMGDRLQIAMVVGAVPSGGSGDISILFANTPAAELFGYESGDEMEGSDVRDLLTPEVGSAHQLIAEMIQWHAPTSGGTMVLRKNGDRIMGSWRNLKGVREDGSLVNLQTNIADIRGCDERYFVAIFRDRTEEVSREKELRLALDVACKSRREAEAAKAEAEASLKKQGDLTKQVNLLLTNLTGFRPQTTQEEAPLRGYRRRQWVIISSVVIFLMFVVLTLESIEGVPVTLLERVLLVLAGVLGTSVSGVLDPKKS